jgi:hypothetical protein
MNEKIIDGVFVIVVTVLGICTCIVAVKGTHDFIFPVVEKKEVVVQQTQKQVDDMCVKWWTGSDLNSAKKRVCGK